MKVIYLLVWLLISANTLEAQVQALPKAHAHNDYLHSKPLFDALAHGFTSIEADIHLINGQLYVVHDKPESLEGLHTLQELYLEPLQKHIQANKGYVYQAYKSPVILMIDIKTEAASTYQVLKTQLDSYKNILYSENNPNGRVQIVLSGNRPIETVLHETKPLASIDGRPEDLPKNYPSGFMPVISQNYSKILQWQGTEPISQEQLNVLKQLVDTTHKQGKKLRLWASPEKENVWQVLLNAGVDFINTDKLAALQTFMVNRKE